MPAAAPVNGTYGGGGETRAGGEREGKRKSRWDTAEQGASQENADAAKKQRMEMNYSDPYMQQQLQQQQHQQQLQQYQAATTQSHTYNYTTQQWEQNAQQPQSQPQQQQQGMPMGMEGLYANTTEAQAAGSALGSSFGWRGVTKK